MSGLAVEFRKKFPSQQKAEMGAIAVIALRPELGGDRSNFAPVLVCRKGAQLRNLDLEVAAEDARHWWKTGLVPLRPTPKSSHQSDSRSNSMKASAKRSRNGTPANNPKPSKQLKLPAKNLETCPECGAKVKKRNLKRHLRKVHVEKKLQVYRADKKESNTAPNDEDKYVTARSTSNIQVHSAAQDALTKEKVSVYRQIVLYAMLTVIAILLIIILYLVNV